MRFSSLRSAVVLVGLFVFAKRSEQSFHKGALIRHHVDLHHLNANKMWPWLDFPTNPIYSNFSSWAGELNIEFCMSFCIWSMGLDINKPMSKLGAGFDSHVGLQCFPCSCDASCTQFGTCCLNNSLLSAGFNREDFKRNLRKDHEEKTLAPSPEFQCISSQTPKPHTNTTFHLVVRECPPNFPNDDVREKCEDSGNFTDLTEATYIHVTDQTTNITYYNQYCAECNNVTKTLIWRLTVDCAHYLFVHTATDADQFLRLSLGEASTCNVTQLPSYPEHSMPCDPWWYADPVASCNATGLWQHYDQFVSEHCERPSPLTNRVTAIRGRDFYEQYILFSNVFCAICNLNEIKYTLRTYHMDKMDELAIKFQAFFFMYMPEDLKKETRLPFSLLLGLRERKKIIRLSSPVATHNSINCKEKERSFAIDKSCLPIVCSPGKVLDTEKRQCLTMLDKVRGLGYNVLLHMVPHLHPQNKNDSSNSQTLLVKNITDISFENVVHFFLSSLQVEGFNASLVETTILKRNKGDIKTKNEPTENIPNGLLLLSRECFVSANLIGNSSLKRDDFEQALASEITKDVVIATEMSFAILIKVTIIPASDKLKAALDNSQGCSNEFQTARLFKTTPGTVGDVRWMAQDKFLQFSRVLVCMHVRLKLDRVTVKQRNTSMFRWPYEIVIELKLGQLVFTSQELNSVQIEDTGDLSVCLDLLEEKLSKLKLYSDWYVLPGFGTIERWQLRISFICLGASIACLLLTVTTYVIFNTLRTLAGVYTMLLAANLMVAQSFLLIAVFFDGTNSWCTFLAILTHFSWLNQFCWSWNCCFHMFRVFTSKTIHSQGKESILATISKRVVFSVAFSGLVVLLVVGISYASTSGQEIGYGKSSCYLNTPLLTGMAMILPMGIITVSNTSFFAIVVWKIQGVRKLQSSTNIAKMDTKQNLSIYVRLSTITGVCWTVSVMAELVVFHPLTFLAIFLNGSQGVFIFLSYVCNSRVLKLYKAVFTKLMSKDDICDTSSDSSSTAYQNVSGASRF
ncbi:G-protein coupled receptor Mth [Elysia marginata]|uniref:G-protein coupled receptor Mth n=1 Tax=Elysia marginata TaxID=1093978 RepID=A0AAV4H013_9GAST|nr:G-protein coupled receptor Mth [Elysia marginata]